jgi:hypothetical protein
VCSCARLTCQAGMLVQEQTLCSACLLTPARRILFFANLTCFYCCTATLALNGCVWADATAAALYVVTLKYSRIFWVNACCAGKTPRVLLNRVKQQLCSKGVYRAHRGAPTPTAPMMLKSWRHTCSGGGGLARVAQCCSSMDHGGVRNPPWSLRFC